VVTRHKRRRPTPGNLYDGYGGDIDTEIKQFQLETAQAKQRLACMRDNKDQSAVVRDNLSHSSDNMSIEIVFA